MKVVLTTLSNSLYLDSRNRLCESAIAHGINEIHEYDFEDIKKCKFYNDNKSILDSKRGIGYWLWKPFIISEELKCLDEGDVLIYIDSGAEIISSLEQLVKLCIISEPILLFGNATDVNATWTKRDTFVLMNCDSEKFWYAPHCDASISIYNKCDQSVNFVDEWLQYSCNANILTDLPNSVGLPNLSGYIDHRHDQSILSLLAQKYHINMYRAPSQFGNHYKMHNFRIVDEFNCLSQGNQNQVTYYSALPYYNSFYGQLVNHHRTKSGEVKNSPLTEPNSHSNKIKYSLKEVVTSLLTKLKIF